MYRAPLASRAQVATIQQFASTSATGHERRLPLGRCGSSSPLHAGSDLNRAALQYDAMGPERDTEEKYNVREMPNENLSCKVEG
jgi:hypothetical protein